MLAFFLWHSTENVMHNRLVVSVLYSLTLMSLYQNVCVLYSTCTQKLIYVTRFMHHINQDLYTLRFILNTNKQRFYS